MSGRIPEYPLYIPTKASELRIQSAKRKLLSNGRQPSRPKSRKVFSAPGVRRSAKTNNRNVLELFKPENFKEIQMHYGENQKSPDCSKLNKTIQTKESEIKELEKKLKHADIKCAAKMGEKVGEEVAKVLISLRTYKKPKSNNEIGSGGGTRRRKKNNKNSKRRTKNRRQ